MKLTSCAFFIASTLAAGACMMDNEEGEEIIDESTSLVAMGTTSSADACGASCSAGYDTYVWDPYTSACSCTTSDECGGSGGSSSSGTSGASSSSGTGASSSSPTSGSGAATNTTSSGSGAASPGPALGGCTADVMSAAALKGDCYYTSHFDGCTLEKIGEQIKCKPRVINYHYDKTHLPKCGVRHNTKACKAYKKVLLNDPYIWEWQCRIEDAKTKCKKYDPSGTNGETPLVE